MPGIIIADTSCLILLEKIGELIILQKLFGEVFVTSVIVKEYQRSLPEWIAVKDPINKTFQTIFEVSVDAGEASAIALALEEKNSLLIMDDNRGRKLAAGLGIKVTGTLGILLEAKNRKYITNIRAILDKIKRTDFRLSEQIEIMILKLANES